MWAVPWAPYVQSQRMGMFKQYAEQLVQAGKAYYCFCTEERLNELHEAQRAAGEMTHYDGHCRDLSAEERGRPPGRRGTLRHPAEDPRKRRGRL